MIVSRMWSGRLVQFETSRSRFVSIDADSCPVEPLGCCKYADWLKSTFCKALRCNSLRRIRFGFDSRRLHFANLRLALLD